MQSSGGSCLGQKRTDDGYRAGHQVLYLHSGRRGDGGSQSLLGHIYSEGWSASGNSDIICKPRSDSSIICGDGSVEANLERGRIH